MNFESLIQMLVLGRFDLADRNNWLTILFLLLPYVRSIIDKFDLSRCTKWFGGGEADQLGEHTEDERVIQLAHDQEGGSYPPENVRLHRAIMFKVNKNVEDWKMCSVELCGETETVRLPPCGTWIKVSDDVSFQVNSERSETSIGTTVYKLRGQNLDRFIQDALEEYRVHTKRDQDNMRYLYMMSSVQNGKSLFKKYVLSDDNTFDTLHIPGKDWILKLVDDFTNREGKFAIPGYPYKLGFLLHGPPGTGKTSFIKALSHHTKRHIVYISLDKVSTNQELMALVYERVYSVDYDWNRLGFHDSMFVFEDVDACCDIVKRRDDPGDEMYKTSAPNASSFNSDPLNLCGILNMLDGLLDSPGRIVVMTTNHPKMLDPALIRPGRVNVQLNLDYIRPDEAKAMFARYFPALPEVREKDFDYFKYSDISPATLEGMCAQYTDLKSLLASLKI